MPLLAEGNLISPVLVENLFESSSVILVDVPTLDTTESSSAENIGTATSDGNKITFSALIDADENLMQTILEPEQQCYTYLFILHPPPDEDLQILCEMQFQGPRRCSYGGLRFRMHRL